jgi:ABC-2 type transport system permease protein
MSLSDLPAEASRTLAFLRRNWIMSRRNAFTIFEILFWPLVGMVSVGLLAEFLSLPDSTRSFILIGVISMGTVQVCQLDVAYVLLYDVWSKSLKHAFIAPVSIRHFLLGSWAAGMVRGLCVFAILAAGGALCFGFDLRPAGPAAIALFLAALFLDALLIGLCVCILVLLLGNRAEVAAWSLVSLMMLLCGIYYPVTILPAPVLVLARLFPLTYHLDYFRSFYGVQAAFGHNLAIGNGLVLLYLLASLYALSKAMKRAAKTGIVLRLSE